jgi:hypothetical protein
MLRTFARVEQIVSYEIRSGARLLCGEAWEIANGEGRSGRRRRGAVMIPFSGTHERALNKHFSPRHNFVKEIGESPEGLRP